MTDTAEVQVTDSKAGRCFYVAHAYLTTGKQLEAHALFGRAADHAKQAVRQHQVRLGVVPQNNHMAISGHSPLLSVFLHQCQMLFAACFKEQTGSLRSCLCAVARFCADRPGSVRPCTKLNFPFVHAGLCGS
jgi:hypothetical protein